MSKKLLLLTHKFFPFIGGIERHSEILAYAFYEAGYDVHVLTWTDDAEQNKFPFQVIRNPNLFQSWKEHAWADIIFENNPCIRLSWPQLLFKKPNFIALHTWITNSNGAIRFQDRLKKIWLKKANCVISCSKAIQKASWPSSIVINNPYDDSVFNIIQGSDRNKDFVFLGRLVSNKGVDLALKLIHDMKIKANKEKLLELKTTLTIIGEGPEK